MGSFGNGLTAVAGKLKAVKSLMWSFVGHPIIAIMALLVNLFNGLKDAVSKNAGLMDRLKVVMTAIAPIGNLMAKIMDKLVKRLLDVAEGIMNLLEKIGLLSTAEDSEYQKNKTVAELEVSQRKENLELIQRQADAEKEVADLRAKAANKEQYNAKQRVAFLNQAIDKETELAAAKKKYAEQEYELIKKRNALTPSSAEDEKAEAEAYANMVKEQTAYYDKVRSLQKEKQTLQNELAADEKRIYEERLKQWEDEQQKLVEQKEVLEMIAAAVDTINNKGKIQLMTPEQLEQFKKTREEMIQTEQDMEQEDADRALQDFQRRYDLLYKYGILQTNQLQQDLANFETREKQYLNSEEEIQKARLSIVKQNAEDIKQQMKDADAEMFQQRLDLLLQMLNSGAIAEQEFLNQFKQMYSEALDQISADSDEKLKKLLNDVTDTLQSWGSNTTMITKQVGALVNAQDRKELQEYKKTNKQKQQILEERLNQGVISQEEYDKQAAALQEEMAKKQFEVDLAAAKREKAMAIMETVINTALGIAKAVSENPMMGGLPGSAIMAAAGALQLATIIAEPLPTYEGAYAQGGIVGGTSFSGDQLNIKVNSGEMVLNKDQQAQLFQLANSNTTGMVNYDNLQQAFSNALLQMKAPVLSYKDFTKFQIRNTARMKNF